MTTNTSMPTDALTVQYDIAGASIWEAFGEICLQLPVDDDSMIVTAANGGTAPNGCGVLEVQFGNLDIAKGFTAVYLGAADADDADVLEYLGVGDFGQEAA
jgi:hypothetical protein